MIQKASITGEQDNTFVKLLPMILALFIGFLSIGLPLAALPLHLYNTLNMSALVIGIVIGSQFIASLFCRVTAGRMSDTFGPKKAMFIGFMLLSSCGIVYQISLVFVATPILSTGILLIALLLLGAGGSFSMTGALSLGIGLVGAPNTGKVMAWVGVAMYGAYAVGAPLGVFLYNRLGFMGISLATLAIPLVSIVVIGCLNYKFVPGSQRVPFYKVLSKVWAPGLGLALCSSGFAVITAFIALLFAEKNWGSASLAFTIFGAVFIAARLLFGHLPDKVGGGKIALICVLIELVGLVLIWRAEVVIVAYLGVALTGFGYSLAFPGFGVEAVARAPVQSRGVAMAAFMAFLDIAMGIIAPIAGVIVIGYSISVVYLCAAVAVAGSAIIALLLSKTASSHQMQSE